MLDGEKDAALAGKRIIISDVVPVMEGLPLKAIPADDYENELALKALGKSTDSSN